MEIIKLTKKEEEWIKDLKKLIRKKPKNLILFADGNLNILKLDKDDNDGVGENGRIHYKIMKWQDENKVSISEAQLDSADFIYDDNAKEEEENK